ncbi:hypothetical protein TREES_T100014642 [Tupaia chinensis]|uniref:Uncharacterized protein n=1 Tax=Tupaia chinensis TaxID=246437 RepID=L9KY29_TUPCH|nr:hypothetical protein TREES_T100014642 [Tupaia chinensis]
MSFSARLPVSFRRQRGPCASAGAAGSGARQEAPSGPSRASAKAQSDGKSCTFRESRGRHRGNQDPPPCTLGNGDRGLGPGEGERKGHRGGHLRDVGRVAESYEIAEEGGSVAEHQSRRSVAAEALSVHVQA